MDYQQQQNQNQNSGLLRFRSAPANLSDTINLDSGDKGVQTEELISRFMNTGNGVNGADLGFRAFDRDKIPATVTEPAVTYGLPPHYPRQSNYNRIMSSMAMDQQIIQPKSVVNSTLLRQSSSPAGLFTHLSAQNQNGYASEKPNEAISPSTKRLKSQLSFPSRLSSSSSTSLGILPQISEIGNEGIGSVNIPDDDGNHQTSNGDVRFYSPGFTFGSWNGNESSHFSDNEAKLLFSDSQNGDIGNRFQPLSHHLSLPKSFSHINQAEKFLEFQDSVPCKIRAKRGCATHPRSIAERVRRTRISERMRKLQELVPNMDKQTNTADMLEFAVDYIKDLQREYKTLSDSRAKCKCLNMQKPVSNHIV